MQLFYRKYGTGQNIVILHGLYGSSDNWVKIAKKIANKYEVFLPDLRNHGASPHSDEFSIEIMKDDLFEFLKSNNIEKTILIGHSLGGKVAMDFASSYPEIIEKLIIVDIAPRNYQKETVVVKNNHQQILNALKTIDLSKYSNRKDALENIVKIDPTRRLMFFMMKNIKIDRDKKMSWKINISAIADNLSKILKGFSADLTKISCPTLFVKGGASPYLIQSDFDFIKSNVDNVKFATIKDATHWLHVEKPDEFVNIIENFVNDL